ncbi:hypothetical protein J1605_008458 [Eschrichtius robustus]|uniref:phosphopyruvate hydratase n=1 Tax=Eschrichtius robustus TaxID=9764 RepID=A0AB34GUZ8_ESCRO|nr:hypothetical protein J1605_008458 [Eschrichtius robustus]
MHIGEEVYHNLKNVIKKKYGKGATNNKEALELLKNEIRTAGYTDEVVIGMDLAASEFFRSGKYDLDFKSPNDLSRYATPDQLFDLYNSFIKDYPLVSIKDLFDQDDWKAWQKFTAMYQIGSMANSLQVCKLAQSDGWGIMVSYNS